MMWNHKQNYASNKRKKNCFSLKSCVSAPDQSNKFCTQKASIINQITSELLSYEINLNVLIKE